MAASSVALPPLPSSSRISNFGNISIGPLSLSSTMISNEMLTHPPKPSHVCPSCSRQFSRAEHLDRHLATHLPSTTSKSFICSSCKKGFTRKDVLTRHVRAVHETKKPDVRRSRRRSCKRCAGFKIKCSGGARGNADGSRGDEACEACKKRGVACVYDFGSTPEITGNKTSTENPKNTISGSADEDEGIDDNSEEERSDDVERASDAVVRGSKRRRTSSSYIPNEALRTPIVTKERASVSHLLSAALLASSSSHRIGENDEFDEESFSAAATVASLGNLSNQSDHRTPELRTGDNFIPVMTAKAFGTAIRPAGSPYSGIPGVDRTYYSHILPPARRQRSQSLHGSSQGSPTLDSSSTPPDLLSNYQQPSVNNSPQRTQYESPFARSVIEEEFRTENPSQSNSSTSFDDSSSPAPEYFSRQTIIIGDGNASGVPGILPPAVSFNFATDDTSAANSPSGFSTMMSNPLENRRDDPWASPTAVNQLESEDNWFFDWGIFDSDWLRQPGFATDPNQMEAELVTGTSISLAERHMSISSNSSLNGTGPGVANPRPNSNMASSKDLPSPSSITSDNATYPSHHQNIRLPLVSPMKSQTSSDDFLPWGWQASREEPKKPINLPPLRQVLKECSSQMTESNNPAFSPRFGPARKPLSTDRLGTVTDQLRSDLIGVLKVPYDRHPYYDDCDIESKFPSKDVINNFIALYFKHFHSIMPVIHRPTFRVDKCHSILLAAMLSIGASYSDVEGAKVFADGLSELCKRVLTWMAEYDSDYLRSDYYLTAFCLQHLYALGSGNSRLYDAADSTRSFLVANARRCGLFSDTTSPCPHSQPSSTPGSPKPYNVPFNCYTSDDLLHSRSNYSPSNHDEGSLKTRWLVWCEQEKRKRLAWAIFAYDCSFSTLSNRRGAVSLNDIQTRLPCEEALWEAQTALAWAAVLSSSSSSSHSAPLVYRGMPFYPTLRDVISGLSPTSIPSWGKELCAWALARMLWDFKEMEQTAVGCEPEGGGGGLGLRSLTTGLKPAKDAVLNTLVTLGDAARECEEAEMEKGYSHRRSLTQLIAHYSHLHAALPTISLIFSLARHPPPCSKPVANVAPIVDERITRLKNLFKNDPTHARTIAWHAAQIIGISRLRPIHTPAETMRVFLAGVVLWGVAKWFVEPRSDCVATTDTFTSDETSVPLDAIPSRNSHRPQSASTRHGVMESQDKKLVNEWIKHGRGRATIRKEGERDCVRETQLCSQQGAKEVLQVVDGILGNMKIWGLGAEFRRVLEGMGR